MVRTSGKENDGEQEDEGKRAERYVGEEVSADFRLGNGNGEEPSILTNRAASADRKGERARPRKLPFPLAILAGVSFSRSEYWTRSFVGCTRAVEPRESRE